MPFLITLFEQRPEAKEEAVHMGNWEKNISVKETACTKALRLEHIHTHRTVKGPMGLE